MVAAIHLRRWHDMVATLLETAYSEASIPKRWGGLVVAIPSVCSMSARIIEGDAPARQSDLFALERPFNEREERRFGFLDARTGCPQRNHYSSNLRGERLRVYDLGYGDGIASLADDAGMFANLYDPEADAIASYNEAVREVGKRVKAGAPVPDFFLSDRAF